MKTIIKILCITLLLTVKLCFSQVNVAISQVQLVVQSNGQTITSGVPIQLGTNTTGKLKFNLKLTKSNELTIGLVRYSIGIYSSSGGFILKVPQEEFYLGDGNTGTTGNYEFDLYDTDLDFAGGCYLGVNVQQLDSPNDPPTPLLSWDSNQVSLKKTPTYYLIANPSSISCGTTAPVTFTVNSNAPSNYSNYQWSYGSGWTLSGSTTGTTLTLTPSASILGQVYVTPTFNGQIQPKNSITVPVQPFTTTATISGSDSICSPSTSANYSLSSVSAGQSINWSSSNTAIATVNGYGNSVTVNRQSNGTFNLIATISNSCGQTVTVQKAIRFGGVPNFTYTLSSNNNYASVHLVSTDETPIELQGITSTTWTQIASTNGGRGGGSGLNGHGESDNYIWSVTLLITASNSCGTSSINAFVTCAPPPPPCDESASLNLVNDHQSIVAKIIIQPCNDSQELTIKKSDQNTITGLEIYDLRGIKVETSNTNSFDSSSLNKGIYIVKANSNKGVYTNKINID